MRFNFAKAKTLVRKVVHDTLSVQAFYKDKTISVPVEITARWHTRFHVFGGADDNAGYAEIIENLDRLIFATTDARAAEIKRGGLVWFPQYETGNTVTESGEPADGVPTFVLQNKFPSTHPYEEVWEVTRK